MEELSGMPAERVIGQNALELFPHFREAGIATLLMRALGGETVTSPKYAYQIPQTGRTGWVIGTYGPHRDAAGQIAGVIGVIRDVTDTQAIRGSASGGRSEVPRDRRTVARRHLRHSGRALPVRQPEAGRDLRLHASKRCSPWNR